jgi:hypothetical protein
MNPPGTVKPEPRQYSRRHAVEADDFGAILCVNIERSN